MMSTVTVEFVDLETRPVLYRIAHQREGRRWEATQRYSALWSMKKSLIRLKVPTPDVPFPPKQGFLDALFCLPMASGALEKRRFGLETYLRAMSSLTSCWESPLAREFLCGGIAESGQADPTSNEDNMVEEMAQTQEEEIVVERREQGPMGLGPLESEGRTASSGKLWNVASSMMMASSEVDGVSRGGVLPSPEIGDGAMGMLPPSPQVPSSVGGANGVISPSSALNNAMTEKKNGKKGKRRGRKGKKK